MFAGLKQSWQAARARELRKIVDDMVKRLPAMTDASRVRYVKTVAIEMGQILETTGDFENVSGDGLKQIAKRYWTDARASYDLDIGRGTALALIAAFAESMALPGEDAKYVKLVSEMALAGAIKLGSVTN